MQRLGTDYRRLINLRTFEFFGGATTPDAQNHGWKGGPRAGRASIQEWQKQP